MAYHLKYTEKLRRRRKSRPLQFGSIVHEVIEAGANGEDPFEHLDSINLENEKLFTAEKEMYGELIEDIRVIMGEYFEYHDDNRGLRYIRRQGKSAEHEFIVPIADGIYMTGKIDALGKTRNNLRWLVEHKTFSQEPKEEDRWRNYQGAVYLKAMEMMGWPECDGILWDYIRSKPPSSPRLLKNGTLSTARCDTLPTVVRAVIKEHGLDVSDYNTLIANAEENRKSYFKRIFAPVNQKTVDYVFGMFVNTAQEIADEQDTRKEMNIGKHCGWCDFEAICRARMTGSDEDFIKEREYYVSETDSKKSR